MSDIDQLGDEPEGAVSGEGEAETDDAAAIGLDDDAPSVASACLSCGAPVSGVFCPVCGQKQDDLRRSLFLLGRDFVEDTFAFDSRMWRTLGLLALSPGIVPTNYSHGKRSRFTPPIRLFLVISFLFFLTVGLTNTLFIGLQIKFLDKDPVAAVTEKNVSGSEPGGQCSGQGVLRFFVKEADLTTDRDRLEACIGNAKTSIKEGIEQAEEVSIGKNDGEQAEKEQASELVERVLNGVTWAVENPRAFNDAVNRWLPRVMLLMTPILALILALFLRRGVFVFDHMVFSLYAHAVGFVIVGFGLIVGQLGTPIAGVLATLGVAFYYVAALKGAYRRGWAKTIWTATGSGAIYMLALMAILVSIVSNVVWRATA